MGDFSINAEANRSIVTVSDTIEASSAMADCSVGNKGENHKYAMVMAASITVVDTCRTCAVSGLSISGLPSSWFPSKYYLVSLPYCFDPVWTNVYVLRYGLVSIRR